MGEKNDIQVNVRIPKGMMEKIEKLIEMGEYRTKTELIRDAIRQLLKERKL